MMMSNLFLLFNLLLFDPSAAHTQLKQQAESAAKLISQDKNFQDLKWNLAAKCGDTMILEEKSDPSVERLYSASVAKLLTTAGALVTLGPSHRIKTEIWGRKEGPNLHDASLVAHGDPSLQISDFAGMARQLKEKGIQNIPTLFVDLSFLDGSPNPPAFDQKQSDDGYRPEVPALSLHSGAFFISFRPGKSIGAPVQLSIRPPLKGINIINKATTSQGKSIGNIQIDVASNQPGTRVTLSGKLGIQAPPQGVKKRLYDASYVAAATFKEQLEAQGIKVGKLRVDAQPEQPGEKILEFQSPTVAKIAALINKPSDNFMAESLFMQLGSPDDKAPTSWEKAQKNLSQTLKDLGLPKDGFRVVNGSGLYEGTEVSATALTQLLSILSDQSKSEIPAETKKAFWDSLTIAGEDGTLKRRMKDLEGRVRGKTGSLNHVRSLAGYLERPECRVSFAILVNGPMDQKTAIVTRKMDEFVRKLAE